MKKIYRKLLWILAVFLIIFLGLNLALIIFGAKIAAKQIESQLKVPAKIERLYLSFPLAVNIRKLELGDLLRADSISFGPSILGFLAGKIVLNGLSVKNPDITLKRDKDGKFNLPQFPQKGKPPAILLAGLNVRDGRFAFVDKKIDSSGYRVGLGGINIRVSKVAFPPTALSAKFAVSASLSDSNNNPSGRISADGWVDFRSKDMDGKIELSGIDIAMFLPYYQNMFSSMKPLSGKLDFNADLKARNNDLTAKCHLELVRLVYERKADDSGGQPSFDIMPNILDLFSNAPERITFDFTIPTKLDNPRFDLVNWKGAFAQAAMQNIASQPPEKVVEKVKEAAKQFKELGKELKEIFRKKDTD